VDFAFDRELKSVRRLAVDQKVAASTNLPD
jgi:hypothetical protein